MTEKYINDTLNSIIFSTENKYKDSIGICYLRLTPERKYLVLHLHKLFCNGASNKAEINRSEKFDGLCILESDFWSIIIEMAENVIQFNGKLNMQVSNIMPLKSFSYN